MSDERDREVSRATGELREYAKILDGYQRTVSSLVQQMNDDKVSPEMWGVHQSFQSFPANPNTAAPGPLSYGLPQAPIELAMFRQAYEAAHEALATRLWKLAHAFEQDAYTYRLIANHYDEDERENLADVDRVIIEEELPRPADR